MNDISVSKIVGSPTQNSWSQASSTGKLYIALSLSSENEEGGIIAKGKSVLEQLQREFFAIDNKNLLEIKNAVEKVIKPLENINYSAVIGAIKDDILYIVTAGEGTVLVARNNSLAQVAKGEEGAIIGFSGKLLTDDIIVLETKEFNRKISNKLLAEYTGVKDSEKLAEDLAPFILEDSGGQEAAIIVHFKDLISAAKEPEIKNEAHVENYHEKKEIEPEYKKTEEKTKQRLPNLELFSNKLKKLNKKQKGIGAFTILVVLLLIGSLFAERYMEKSRADMQVFESVYSQASEKLESAKSLSSLNRGRALEEISLAIADIENNLSKFKEGSSNYERLSALLNELKKLNDELGGGSEVAGTPIFSSDDSEITGSLSQVVSNENGIFVIGEKGYTQISEGGDIESEEDLEIENVRRAIADDTSIYLLGSNVNRITISNSNTTEIIEGSEEALDISYFGSNIYLLNNGGEVVTRFSGSSYNEANYFQNSPQLSGKPLSFAIDSSIYILTDDSTITKFTRGSRDDKFELDSSLTISKNAILYGNENLSNIYLLDIDNGKIVQIKPDGTISKQFNASNLSNAKSFTVNNGESKAFVVADNQVYSFDL